MSVASLRDAAIEAVRWGLAVTLRVLTRVVPTTRTVLVSGFPETEGNAVEVLSALLRRYDGKVVWLREPEGPHADLPDDSRLVVAGKTSLAGMWHYARAEAVFFTHGLYGSPRPRGGRTVVNLWHGDGPKDLRPASGPGAMIASSHVVAGTRLFGEAKAEAFEVDRLLLTGNPRTDQLFRPVDDERLAELGITSGFVLWMPTFRTTKGSSVQKAWSEGGAEVGVEEVAPLLELLRERGMQLVVKPHPMDAEERRGPGVVHVTNEDLARVGVPLYTLIGRAAGMVTDYSSVWVDYLLLDRPMAFLVPDRDTYTRGLQPADILDWLPGEMVGEQDPFAAFVADLDSGGALGREERRVVAERIGLVQSRTSADDLLDALADEGALRLRGSSTSLRARRKGRSSQR